MRFVAIPILILLLMTQTFSKWVLILNYQVNKDYIAAKLCENKTRPQLHCNGKCLLMKKMKAAEEKESAPVNSGGAFKVNLSETWSNNFTDFELPLYSFSIKTPKAGFYLLKKYTALLQTVFRPPLV